MLFKLKKTPPLIEFARLAWRRFDEERCLQIGSSLTFTALLAIVPIITVALTMMSAFPVFRELLVHIETFLVANMLPESAESIAAYAEKFAENAARLTAVGIVLLFVTAMVVLNTIDRAFNQIWRAPRPRATVQRLFIYWAILTVGPVLIGASLSLTSWLVSQSLGLVKDLPLAGEVLLKVVPIGLTGIAFSLLYFAMPNRRVLVRDALSGGFLAALAFEWMKHGFAAYIAHFPTHAVIYGAFASVPIFLLWIYLSWIVLLVGAVSAAVMPEWRDRALRSDPAPGGQFLDALKVLHILRRAHQSGEIVPIQRLHIAVRLPMDRIESALDAMSGAGWVGRVASGWTLTKDASEITVADLYRQFVFRAAPATGERRAMDEVDRLGQELAGVVDNKLAVTLEELFDPPAAQPQAPGDQRMSANVLRLG